MKKNILVTLVLLLSVYFSYGQATEGFELSGKVEGVTFGKMFLTYGDGRKDSVDTSDGTFRFSAALSRELYCILELAPRKHLGIFLSPGDKIKLSADVANPQGAVITGAKLQPDWQDWMQIWRGITAKAGALYERQRNIPAGGDMAPILKEFQLLDSLMADSTMAYVKRHRSSAVSAWIITDRFITYPYPQHAVRAFALLEESAKNSGYGKELSSSLKIAAKSAPGSMPEITAQLVNGNTIKLSSLRGKYVLVDFWASWCGPCRKENPNLVKAYKNYHDKVLEILGISLDTKRDAWLKAIDDDHLSWLHASDLKGWKSGLVGDFGIRSIPMNFLVDTNGKVIAKDIRGEELEKVLGGIFK